MHTETFVLFVCCAHSVPQEVVKINTESVKGQNMPLKKVNFSISTILKHVNKEQLFNTLNKGTERVRLRTLPELYDCVLFDKCDLTNNSGSHAHKYQKVKNRMQLLRGAL